MLVALVRNATARIATQTCETLVEKSRQIASLQEPLVSRTVDTLNAIGDHFGMNATAVEACVKDQALLDKITADQKFAVEELKVDATPTFFVNGEILKGAMSFEELDNKLSALLKR